MNSGETKPSQGPSGEAKAQSMELRLLKEHEPFRLVFQDGKSVQAKLLDINQYNVVIETARATLLVPKHSIKYYILEETAPSD
jgi:sRNA-binding regulator protein Hfq